jgi:murein L,D-transpeptidase YafK
MWRRFLPLMMAGLLAPSLASATEYRITVKKAERRLELQRAGQLVKTYRIGLGFAPAGIKEKQGDGRTPEGNYFICNKNPKSRFYLSLGLNYPNADDARRGLEQGLIGKNQYGAIIGAEKRKTVPPWNTNLGGEIFIHGRGANSDWTWGCIALDDVDIRELYEIISIGTVVTVLP